MKVDRNEAPDGYRAYEFAGKKLYTCEDCAFFAAQSKCEEALCVAACRKDGVSVIFKKIKGEIND